MKGVPLPWLAALVGAPVEFFGGLAVVLGIAGRYAALLMFAFTVVATLISHRSGNIRRPPWFRRN